MDQQRWKVPFGTTPIEPHILTGILASPMFGDIRTVDFPVDLPLGKIIAYDGRILRFDRNELIYCQQDYGNSVFVVLRGHVRCMTAFDARNSARIGMPDPGQTWVPSIADIKRLQMSIEAFAAGKFGKKQRGPFALHERPGIFVGKDEMFGVAAALRRTPRCNTATAGEDGALVLELRWSGIRDLRFWSNVFRTRMDELYRVESCSAGLRQCWLFNDADDEHLQVIAENSIFETYGELAWSHRYQLQIANPSGDTETDNLEPVISEQGERLHGLLVVCSGFVRVSHTIGQAELTVGFLTGGDVFGLDRLTADLNRDGSRCAEYSLRACGYADAIWIPRHVIEAWQEIDPETHDMLVHRSLASNSVARGTELPQSFLDFIVDNRLVNGTSAMVINTDRCVNCDACVQACAATHDNVPRFVRKGKAYHNLMVANACMHCIDPVCMIDCPTDAIHRHTANGNILIDATRCVGCGACANACPYDNIRMEKTSPDDNGNVSGKNGSPVLTAIKCDLCAGLPGGPACTRSCPHDAISRMNMEDTALLSDWLQTGL